VARDLGPIVGGLIGRKGEGEKNDEVCDEAAEADQHKNESALTAHGPGERKIGEERAEQHDAEQRPAAINILHDEIVAFGQVDLVRQRKEMRAAGNQRQRSQNDRKKFEGPHPVTVPNWTRPSTQNVSQPEKFRTKVRTLAALYASAARTPSTTNCTASAASSTPSRRESTMLPVTPSSRAIGVQSKKTAAQRAATKAMTA